MGRLTALPCRAVLFDCDGVLVDSRASGERCWTQWAAEHGLGPDAVLAGLHGRRTEDSVALFIAAPGRAAAAARIEALEIADATSVRAIPGAAALLAGLPGAAWAVVTSASAALAGARLGAAGLPAPPVLVSAADVARGKPAPDGYRAAAARLGVSCAEAVVVEDSPTGIAAARAAGAGHVVGVGPSARGAGADVVVADLAALRWGGDGLRALGR